MGKKGGTTQSTVTQTNLPEYARPYFEDLMSRAESESTRPYSPYEGARIADPTQATLDAQAGITGMTQNPLYDQAGAGLGQAATQAAGVGGMNPYNFSQFGYNPNVQDYRTDVQGFMSPYMQGVVDVQKDKAILDFQRAQAGRDAQAVQAGAFGGSRSAVVDALAQEDLSRNLGNIQATGLQNAFDAASGAFGQQRAAQMQRDAERAAELARVQGSTADERFRYGQLGLDSAQLQGALAGQMGTLAGQQQQALLDMYGAQNAVGRDIQAQEQAYLDQGYQDFINQRDYGRDQLSFYSSLLRGIPVTPSTETQQIVNTNPLQQLLGGGLAALGTYRTLSG